MQRVVDREIAPGVQYMRLRIDSYPLNVNMLKVDLTNPGNRVETTVANESAKGTELLVNASKRLAEAGKRPVAAANGNFWIVSSQTPDGKVFNGITRNASVRNGKMVTESNQYLDKWDKGTTRTGVVAISYDGTAYVDYCTSAIRVKVNDGDAFSVHQCNKGMQPGELCMYNSFYGRDRAFMPIRMNADKMYEIVDRGDAVEVLLDLKSGQEWGGGRDIRFEVKEVRRNAGNGTLGNYDLALVGRGRSYSDYKFKDIKPGDEVTLEYHWTFDPDGERICPDVEQAIGGNALVMRHGELTEHNDNEDYNSMVYSRTGYGCSADGKTLYIIVIDKSTDPVYGKSAGCNTAKMCEIARYFGCYNMANFDAGGSAEMMVDGAIVNTTTESTPRAVANGLMIFSLTQ
ncbi:MAG: phosphodiester glycosidase family protein [Muribaculaceae bacterium]|nr:phosphodiester glycosidase family protein [Muribaculaceae bacterium]